MAEKKLLFSVGLNDCKVETFTVGGHGGSGKDTSNTGVRITHLESGATARCVDSRSQFKNKQIAFRRMCETKAFKAWHKKEVAKRLGVAQKVDEEVENALMDKHLKVEVFENDRWVERNIEE